MLLRGRKWNGVRLGSWGFSLIELSISMLILGFLVSGIFKAIPVIVTQMEQKKQENLYDTTRSALYAFIAQQNPSGPGIMARFPCPASLTAAPGESGYGEEQRSGQECSTGAGIFPAFAADGVTEIGYIGAVPTATLRIPGANMLDAYGNRLTYVVSKNLVKDGALNDPTNQGQITIMREGETDPATAEIRDAQFALISHGESGFGAYSAAGGLVANCEIDGTDLLTVDAENCDNDDAVFREADISKGLKSSFYDDKLAFTLVDEKDDEYWMPVPGDIEHITNKNPGVVCIGQSCDPSVSTDDGDALLVQGHVVVSDGAEPKAIINADTGDLALDGAIAVGSPDITGIANGDIRVSNNIIADGEIHAPVFKDKDDTSYVVNPAGMSKLSTLTVETRLKLPFSPDVGSSYFVPGSTDGVDNLHLSVWDKFGIYNPTTGGINQSNVDWNIRFHARTGAAEFRGDVTAIGSTSDIHADGKITADGYGVFSGDTVRIGTNVASGCSSTTSSVMLAGSQVWDGCDKNLHLRGGATDGDSSIVLHDNLSTTYDIHAEGNITANGYVSAGDETATSETILDTGIQKVGTESVFWYGGGGGSLWFKNTSKNSPGDRASVSQSGDLWAKGVIRGLGYRTRSGTGTGSDFGDNNVNFWWSGSCYTLYVDITPFGIGCPPSDRRRKKNIQDDLESGLERIMKLRPVVFEYRKDNPPPGIENYPTLRHGLIADEVQDIIPSAVTGKENAVDKDGNPVYQTLNYDEITPVLTKAVQELARETDKETAEQDKQIVALQAENEALRARLDALEAMVGIQAP